MMTRRRFLELWQGVAAFLAAGAAVPAFLFWWRSPVDGAPESSGGEAPEAGEWVELGRLSEVPEGEWTRKTLTLERQDRWRRGSARELVYLRREDDEVKALSAVCPHTGCLVRPEGDGFTCPCHKSFFDTRGEAVDGPSPRGLDPLETAVEGRKVRLRYQRFRSGVAVREVLEG